LRDLLTATALFSRSMTSPYTLLLRVSLEAMAKFPSTQWSLIRRSGDSPSARRLAFGELALSYRGAIRSFFSARLPAADADDATQGFMSASFEHAWWSRADAECGSFRGFLLLLLRRYLGHLLQARQDRPEASAASAEVADPAPTAEQLFDTRFALLLSARAIDNLRLRYRERGRGALFEQLLPLLAAPPEHGRFKHIAESLGLPANTLTVECKRLRTRLRERMRAELLELCADQQAFDDEWAALERVLNGHD